MILRDVEASVDHEGEVLEAYVTKKRDRWAALKFLKKAMKRYGRPKTVVTDLLRSYGAALKSSGLRSASRRVDGSVIERKTRINHSGDENDQ